MSATLQLSRMPLFSKSKAPELRATRWFNSPPLTWKDLRGRVVLVDFMDYSCVNCVRTFPHMRYLWSKLKDKGFVLIGVHTPEFVFAKDFRNLEDAIKRHGLEYPIAVDNDYEIWNAFGNQYWPAQYFVDAEGNIRHFHAGEGGEQEIEDWITLLLKQAGREVSLEPGPHEEEVVLRDPISPETYCGFLRNTGMGNPVDCDPQGNCAYHDRDKSHQLGVVYLDGMWTQTEEYLEHLGSDKGHILLAYQAGEVNLVMVAEGQGRVDVLIDGAPIQKGLAGADVRFEGERAFMTIDRQDMFRIVKGKSVERHELTLATSSPGLRCYAYTFGP